MSTKPNNPAEERDQNAVKNKFISMVRFVSLCLPWVITIIAVFGPASFPIVVKYVKATVEYDAFKKQIDINTYYIKQHCQNQRDIGNKSFDCTKL